MARLALLLTALVACSRPRPRSLIEWMAGNQAPDPGIPVRILSWPEHPALDCYLSEMPAMPEDLQDPQVPMVTEDVFMRSFVRWWQFNELVDAYRDLYHWAGTVHACVEALKKTSPQ